MANYSYTNNGINFTLQDNDILQFKKLSNADGEFSRGVVVPLINAVEIDWNKADLANATAKWPGSGEYIETTGQLLAAIKAAYNHVEIGTTGLTAAAGNHTHNLTLATDSGTPAVTLAAATTYKLTSGGKTLIFKTPADANTTYSLANLIGTTAIGSATKPIYWDGSKFVTANNYPSGVSTLTLAKTGTSTIDLLANTTYTLTVGDKTLSFKTPADNTGSAADGNTTYKLTLNGTVKGTTGGTDLGTIYAPASLGNAGQVLKVNSAGTGLTWGTDNTGSSTTVNAATLKSLLVAGPNIAIKAWSDLTDEEKTIYGDSSIGMSDGKLIIINTYQPIDMYYKIQFNKNGGTGTLPSNMGPYASGTMVQIPSVSLTRSGYTLSGWNTKTDGSGTSYAFNSTYIVPSNSGTLTLYAKWIANKTNPTLTIGNPASTTIADGKTTTITVTSSVAGKLTLTTSSGTGWSATSSSTNTAATSHTITVSNLTATTTAGSIAVGGIVATFTPTDTTNYNTLTNQSVLKQAITLSAKVATNTYYYYAGWTQPTASNVDTVIAETYPSESGSTTTHTAGKKTTSKSTMDYTSNTLYNANAKATYYVLVPIGHAIYDSLNNNVIASTFTSKGNITVGNQTHTVYASNSTSRNIGAIIIKYK